MNSEHTSEQIPEKSPLEKRASIFTLKGSNMVSKWSNTSENCDKLVEHLSYGPTFSPNLSKMSASAHF